MADIIAQVTIEADAEVLGPDGQPKVTITEVPPPPDDEPQTKEPS